MPPQPDDPTGNGTIRPANASEGGPRVFDAEVLGPEDGDGPRGASGASGPGQWSNPGASGGARFYRVGGTFSGGGAGFGRMWTATGASGTSCLAPCITFALFFVCLSQFGLLAGLGFAVFHLVGSIAGSIRAMRLLVEGREANPWSWRLGNWFVSFMLTVWLAGGFNG